MTASHRALPYLAQGFVWILALLLEPVIDSFGKKDKDLSGVWQGEERWKQRKKILPALY